MPCQLVFTVKSPLRRENEGFLAITCYIACFISDRLTEISEAFDNGNQPRSWSSSSRCHRNAQRTRVLRKNPVALAFVNATSPGMLLAATALTPLPRLSQECRIEFIMQAGAAGVAE